ncbi:universal stress protein [Actinoplanes teichomyceticus]|uniref:Nucleotide-binding universal stress UspA family protein n=1 Tax=Actinoplanes teichomyceticus TaxID=1867 RepID=A0A561VC90_ACTTI|nr:universal stress protein [Actinoplanes teichomyceticus]TWG09236.1 nucleotide-binding universal stress UspA family protein [Actinoplanes teichomyceticus]GIF17121.1 universal stress protein [Actinoplanes teichomyceticus]
MYQRKIVIGFDGSPSADAALAWALDEANRTGARAELVYADEWSAWGPATAGEHVDPAAGDMLRRAVAAARRTHPGVGVTATTVPALACTALADRSDRAGMIVLGTRGHSALAGLVGSVGAAVGAHAHCPVVVVHGDVRATAPVVAGVDDSPSAAAVLRFAARQAAGRGVGLRVLRIGTPDGRRAHAAPFGELVAAVRAGFPGLDIEAETVRDDPAGALVTAGDTAQLLVVGARGHGAVRGLLLGTVSRHLLRHAGCPVAIVHDAGRSGPVPRARRAPLVAGV